MSKENLSSSGSLALQKRTSLVTMGLLSEEDLNSILLKYSKNDKQKLIDDVKKRFADYGQVEIKCYPPSIEKKDEIRIFINTLDELQAFENEADKYLEKDREIVIKNRKEAYWGRVSFNSSEFTKFSNIILEIIKGTKTGIINNGVEKRNVPYQRLETAPYYKGLREVDFCNIDEEFRRNAQMIKILLNDNVLQGKLIKVFQVLGRLGIKGISFDFRLEREKKTRLIFTDWDVKYDLTEEVIRKFR